MAAGDEVEWPHLRGQGPTVWPEIGTEAVQRGGRCHAVGTHEDGWYGCDPLPGRFSVVRSSGLPSVCGGLEESLRYLCFLGSPRGSQED